MNFKKTIVLFLIILIFIKPSYGEKGLFDNVQKDYINKNQDKVYTIGLYPMSGKDYFNYENKTYGYMLDLVKILKSNTNLEFKLKVFPSWDDVYNSFLTGEIDLLFGANKTKKREEKMIFTQPLDKIPYAIFINKESNLLTIGDFENKILGFTKSDMIIDIFKKEYNNLDYKQKIYVSQNQLFKKLSNKKIDGFITSGGIMAYKFLYDYEDIKLMTQLDGITSNLNIAALKENKILIDIIKEVLKQPNIKKEIEQSKDDAELIFNRKILCLTKEEKKYLENNKKITVGVLKNYLPFELYKDGKLLGVSGKIFNYISKLINFETKVVVDDFHSLYEKALEGKIDLLILAKTDKREKHFDFPRPFYKERDIIYGNGNSKNINSVYQLENKKVAVIKEYWHEDYLKKNLRDPKIITTSSIKESLRLLSNNEVDYIIENRLVGNYYIDLYSYKNIKKKGVTTVSSALYYAIPKGNKALVSLIDKALKIIDYKKLESKGLNSIPHSEPIKVKNQRAFIVLLIVFLIFLVYLLFYLFNRLVNQRAKSKLLKEKQKMMYKDALTGLKNRSFFNNHIKDLNDEENLCFLIIDLNDLKEINDTYGHLIGDELIKTAAITFQKVFKNFEHIRFGGDEFLFITKDISKKKLNLLIDKSTKISKKTKISFGDITLQGFSFGIGFAIRKNKNEPINSIFARADKAMYKDKSKTKNL
ncbi:MAG: transporter substrate-binding domain-containing diguanylate cyclase [Bacillota bacterium]